MMTMDNKAKLSYKVICKVKLNTINAPYLQRINSHAFLAILKTI